MESALGSDSEEITIEVGDPTVPRVRGSEDGLTLETVFGILEDKERRFLLYLLHGTDRRWHDLAEVIERIERHHDGCTDEELWLSVVHTHLPKLSAAGLVQYDESDERVRYDGHPLLDEWLQRTRRQDLH